MNNRTAPTNPAPIRELDADGYIKHSRNSPYPRKFINKNKDRAAV
jgi:competence protein ComGC